MKVEFYRHSLGEEEKKSVGAVLDSLFLTAGPRTREFEEKFAAYLGVEHCVGLSSCTAALFLTLKAWQIGPGDKVIAPAMTFIATSNVVLHCGAEVQFCDVDPGTALIDLNQVEAILKRERAVKAVIPVHLYGQMVDMKALRALADRYGAKLLEDSAHCIEGIRDAVRPGQLGDAAAFSFYATKNMASGEGGAVATDDAALADALRTSRLHGMSQSAVDRHQFYQHWDMAVPGFKENMFDLQAALLLPQLARIERLWGRREAIARRYEQAFAPVGIDFPKVLPGVKSARHLFTIWSPRVRRDELLARLQNQGVGCVVNYRAVHLREYYRRAFGYKEGDFPVAEEIGDRTISIPLYPSLRDEEVEYVITEVIQAHPGNDLPA
jgi:UDP-4-amino-4-deoxy-L-arabinose-oxoglutarate aminotransferase